MFKFAEDGLRSLLVNSVSMYYCGWFDESGFFEAPDERLVVSEFESLEAQYEAYKIELNGEMIKNLENYWLTKLIFYLESLHPLLC